MLWRGLRSRRMRLRWDFKPTHNVVCHIVPRNPTCAPLHHIINYLMDIIHITILLSITPATLHSLYLLFSLPFPSTLPVIFFSKTCACSVLPVLSLNRQLTLFHTSE